MSEIVKLQSSSVEESLRCNLPRINAHESEVSMVLVDLDDMIKGLPNIQVHKESLSASVFGRIVYDYDDFEICLHWKILDAKYKGVVGVRLFDEKVEILDIELTSRGIPARLYDRNTLVREKESNEILRIPFQTHLNDWKIYPLIDVGASQPTHYSVKKPLVGNAVGNGFVHDVYAIPEKTYPQIKKIAREEGFEIINTCYDPDKFSYENKTIHMEGFSTYRLGNKNRAMFVHIHWVVKGPLSFDANRNEIAIIESDNVPGAFLTGLNLVDSNHEYVNQDKEVFAILRLISLFKLDQKWIWNVLEMMKKLLDDQLDILLPPQVADQKQRSSDKERGMVSDKTRFVRGGRRDQSHRKESDNATPEQLDLFVGQSEDEYQSHTVLDGDKKVQFFGRHVAQAVDNDKKNSSGTVNILDLYQTDKNQWIGVKIRFSKDKETDKNQLDSSSAQIFENENQLFEFFGYGFVACELYEQAKIKIRHQGEDKGR